MTSNTLRANFLLLTAVLVWVLPSLVHAELECTDFLTISYPGRTKLPLDAFDYNTSIDVLRVSSSRVDSFSFPDAEKGYFFVAVGTYAPRNVSAGQVVYQYTTGVADFYYKIFNGTSVPWFCNLEKMADLKVNAVELSGAFYSSSGQRLDLTKITTLELDSGVKDGFFVPGFGTSRRVYVAAQGNASGFAIGYLIYDAENQTFFATDFKQARYRVPANATGFCKDLPEFCLDASGKHGPTCKGAGVLTYTCGNNACVSNLTACKFGCEKAACLESKATPSSSPEGTANTSASVTVSQQVSIIPSATSAAPPASKGLDATVVIIVLLVLLAAGYYFLVVQRRPRGL